jgi:hypothetical protein
MRNMILAGLALSALAAAPAAAAPAPALLLDADAVVLSAATAASSQANGVRVWMDRDLFGLGDRNRVRVRTDHDAYLAVFHIDTNGDVDVIFPRSYNDDGWVEGGRTLNLGSRGGLEYLNVRGGYGMGYVMAVALDEPLEMWRMRDMYDARPASWDGGRSVYGDPFYAMDEIVRAVVPEQAYGYESVDYYTYHVGRRRYDYPRYACYDAYGPWYYDTYYDYYGRGSCDRVRLLLVHRPYYYDTYRWRGSRRVYYDRYYFPTTRTRPLHGYKERTDGRAPPVRSSNQRRPSGGGSTPDVRTGTARADRPGSTRPGREGTAVRPERGGTVDARPENGGASSARPGRTGTVDARRPETTERAAPAHRPERGTYEPRVRDRGGENRGGATTPRARDTGSRGPSQPRQPDETADRATPPQQDRPVEPQRERPTFQRRPQESGRSAEPRRESPPQRSAEPRRESPPQRSAEPRRESPPARSAEPRRESPPARSSAPRSEPSRSRESSGSRTRPPSDN